MAKTKSATQAAEKWKNVTPGRTSEYVQGVENPKTDWKTATKNAETNWKSGVNAAAQRGAFGKGVDKAGTSKWQQNTIQKGQTRWGEGVALAENTYAEAIDPFIKTIEATDLGPKYPKGDPRNIDRVRKIADALHKKKIQG